MILWTDDAWINDNLLTISNSSKIEGGGGGAQRLIDFLWLHGDVSNMAAGSTRGRTADVWSGIALEVHQHLMTPRLIRSGPPEVRNPPTDR